MIADNSYNVNSFFAGIGGFDLGFEKAGFSNSFLCENNDFCNRVLASHWPDVPKAGDINEVAPSDIPDAPVWCGGFPCQDISVARGSMSRLGLNGSRSGLFYRFACFRRSTCLEKRGQCFKRVSPPAAKVDTRPRLRDTKVTAVKKSPRDSVSKLVKGV